MIEDFSGWWKGLIHAWRGLRLAFRTERSFRFQIVAACLVLIGILLFPFQRWERVLLLLATVSILVLELLNSMVERLVDLVKPRMHGYVHDIKDLMAAAVLVASFFALIIAALIVWPYFASMAQRV